MGKLDGKVALVTGASKGIGAASAKAFAAEGAKVGQPDDIASVAVFLASEDARWLTGERRMASGGSR